MKILVFTGGLGNQIFGYSFYNYLKDKYKDETIYGIYNENKMSEHNGLEINKYFDVQLPKSPLHIQLFTAILYCLKKIGIGKKFISMDTRTFNPETIVNNACKMDITLMPPSNNWINFKDIKLSNQNQQILDQIKNNNSVFLHVRRGDYYSPQYIKKLGGTCPINYYEKAIHHITSKNKDIKFFVFSDDIAWVKENLMIPNPTYIDWNTGNDSFIDMYLMSQCKHAIIANSTFSYWGAQLGRAKDTIIYPTKWVNEPYTAPSIFPKHWITY